MTSKTPYKMFNLPTQDYAKRYCETNGLQLGGTYFIIEQPDENNIFISDGTEKIAVVGSTFFKQHFKIDLRTINLYKLI